MAQEQDPETERLLTVARHFGYNLSAADLTIARLTYPRTRQALDRLLETLPPDEEPALIFITPADDLGMGVADERGKDE